MHRICRAHGQRVLVNMIAMNMVEMAVVQIIDIVYGTELPSIPEVGAVCGKAARTDLGRGREVTRVPTAKICLLQCMSQLL